MGSYEGEGPKKFTVGFRGYKREPVDQYVERLHGWLLDSEARAENAVEDATVAVGDRREFTNRVDCAQHVRHTGDGEQLHTPH